jgi:RimJ/RimL family protein N-acetyltransferase
VTLAARWSTPLGVLRIAEPTDTEVRAAAGLLADFYNDPHNAALLTNTIRFEPEDVVQFVADARAEGTRPIFLYRDDALVGDGDFRNIARNAAEVAILVGPRRLQGQGLGRRFVTLALALGFERLPIERVYAVIRPENAGSLRMFGHLGFAQDDTAVARSFAEEDDDVCVSLGRSDFATRAAVALGEIHRG